ncbi:7TM GPCR serpentine receptor class x (Srx) domain-containing protein [Caenorhabditis elegans]|uniref:7TM GPCR serpentine receptor class x (Srx) domain-containing protein n=1 Tax=Caenorhabditis elegans TaxID=6239 RepID=Q17975_CAEEL|nr:7TM GPCR serpentine receptor class x (Srx) domain-containing protein [Caenorhabditis elegans]CCD64499.1 7TM GPCR serpentine receptor class x (Srx) domain-containing protein [Caenorhabditis elegans]|eukprot:NP_504487.1 Serpentine Receptor, class X [Caenorhabditis elegans]
MTLDEFLSTGEPTENVRIVAATLLTIVSVFGSIFNTLVFVSLLLRVKKKDGFLKICCAKSFGNDIVCIGYLFWPIPVTFFNSYFLPHMFNAFMGQLVGWFGWSIGPLSQVLLTSNRVLAVFFPHLYHKTYRVAPSNVGIMICLFLSFLLFAAFFPEGCHYLYNLKDIGWLPEQSLCTSIRRSIFIVSMIIIVIVTSVCGFLLFFRLIADANAMSTVQSTSRRSKNQKILFQTLTQNMLILVDTLNTTVTYKLFPVLFFQFLTLSFSMVFLRALEGFIMFKMNERIDKGVRSLLGLKTDQLKNLQGAQSVMIWAVSSTSRHNN